jgi:hypothetical protein
MIDERFAILGALLSFGGVVVYLVETIRGTSRPNRVTWFLWSLVPFIAFFAQIKEGVGYSSLLTFVSGFGPFLVFLASFINKKSYWEIGRFDIVCGAIAIVGVVLWLVTNNPNLAILFSIIADGAAASPTVVKSIKFPETESYLAYLGGGVGAVLTLLTITNWQFANYAFPLYILLLCTILTVLIKFEIGSKFRLQSSSTI